jgi:hypothetical protein
VKASAARDTHLRLKQSSIGLTFPPRKKKYSNFIVTDLEGYPCDSRSIPSDQMFQVTAFLTSVVKHFLEVYEPVPCPNFGDN